MMKAAFLLLVLAFACPSRASSRCKVENGNQLTTNGKRAAKMDFPCKYAAVRQQCGRYWVRITPGNIYMAPRFFINTMWVEVNDTVDGGFWQGRTDNNRAVKFMNDIGDYREALSKKAGDLDTDKLFNFNHTNDAVFVEAADGSFTFKFGPYDPVHERHHNVEFVFVCHLDDVPEPFPKQMCGGPDKKDVQYEADALGFKTGKAFKTHMRDRTYLYAIFMDTEVQQNEPMCRAAVTSLTKECKTKEKRVEAINSCYRILASQPHRECASKFNTAPIEVFANCLKMVCSDYTDKAACQLVGESIDLCREFPDLTDNVKKCYNDLFVIIDPDNVDYSQK